MEKRTELAEVGEFGLIDRLEEKFSKAINKTTVKGIGDDAAVIDIQGDDYLLFAADMLVEGIHFDLSYMPLKHLGYKAAVTNFSDIAAMNGLPEQITVSLGLSNRFSIEAIEELYEGFKLACENYKVDLVGGDTTSSRSGLIISISVIGRVNKDRIAYRSTAKEGDIVCVTGDLGGAYMGLQVLEREKQGYSANPNYQPELSDKEYIVGRQLRPEARTDIVHEFKEKDIVPTSLIDISDGLASEILHICTQSNVGVQIFYEKIPLDELTKNTSIEFDINPSVCALNGGEDYELLFTIKQEDFEKVRLNSDITPIGIIKNKSFGYNLVTENSVIIPIKAQGWKHF
jgi:thiamine-monophosphate kinase